MERLRRQRCQQDDQCPMSPLQLRGSDDHRLARLHREGSVQDVDGGGTLQVLAVVSLGWHPLQHEAAQNELVTIAGNGVVEVDLAVVI